MPNYNYTKIKHSDANLLVSTLMRVSVLISALVSTSCMKDFSQFGVVVADHIPHSSSSQCYPPHLV